MKPVLLAFPAVFAASYIHKRFRKLQWDKKARFALQKQTDKFLAECVSDMGFAEVFAKDVVGVSTATLLRAASKEMQERKTACSFVEAELKRADTLERIASMVRA